MIVRDGTATPGAAQRDIKTSLMIYDQILALTTLHATATPQEFSEAYKAAAFKMQIGLGDPGFGPVASLDTERADANLESYVAEAQRSYDKLRAAAK